MPSQQAKCSLPVAVRVSKRRLLKLPNNLVSRVTSESIVLQFSSIIRQNLEGRYSRTHEHRTNARAHEHTYEQTNARTYVRTNESTTNKRTHEHSYEHKYEHTYEQTNARTYVRTYGRTQTHERTQSKSRVKYDLLTWLLMLQWYILVRKDTCQQKQHGTLLQLQSGTS